MLRLLTDENINKQIVRGLRRRLSELDCIVVQEAGLSGSKDEGLLELAAIEGRALLTHDVKTMIGYAYARIAKGLPMTGLIVVPAKLETGRALNDLELFLECMNEQDLKDQVHYLPL